MAQKRRTGRGRALAAAGLVLGLHVVLFSGFKVRPPLEPLQYDPEQPRCVFLAPRGAGPEWQDALRDWCDVADPTILSLPNSLWGFSRIREEPRPEPYESIPAFEPAGVQPTPDPSFPPLELASAPPDMASGIPLLWERPAVGLETQPSPVPVEEEPVLWRGGDGLPLPGPPEMVAADVAAALAAGGRPGAETVLELNTREDLSRVRVRSSSGNRQLDLVAVAALSRQVARVAGDAESGGSLGTTSQDGDNRVVRVVWEGLGSAVTAAETGAGP